MLVVNLVRGMAALKESEVVASLADELDSYMVVVTEFLLVAC